MGANTKKLSPFLIGECFICGKPCEKYCHYECAVAIEQERGRRIKETAEKERQEKNGEKNEEIKCQKEA